MDVRLPDGTIVRNVPEGTTKEQLLNKLSANGHDVSSLSSVPVATQQQSQPMRINTDRLSSLPEPVKDLLQANTSVISGLSKGAIIEPLKAVAHFGVAGALKLGLINQKQADEYSGWEKAQMQQYDKINSPSSAAETVEIGRAHV